MRIIEYILHFERHLRGAINLKSKDLKDYFIYNTLAMECSQAVNTLIDLAQYSCEEKVGLPLNL